MINREHMTKIAEKLTELVGNTPLLQLNRLVASEGAKAQIIAKLESFNPQGSVKDRIALAMVEDWLLFQPSSSTD